MQLCPVSNLTLRVTRMFHVEHHASRFALDVVCELPHVAQGSRRTVYAHN